MNALFDEGSGRELASRLPFYGIPQSLFVKSDGTVDGSMLGPLSEGDMRARLDALLATQ